MIRNQTLTLIAATILCVTMAGCLPRRTVSPLGGGYEEVVRTWTSISEPEATQIGLQYQKPSGGRIMVWPSVRGYIIKDGLAVFIGNRAYEVLDPDDHRATSPRVFVVKAPEMSFDITDEIILHWAQASGKDSVKALKSAAIVALELHDDKVNCDFEFSDWPETIIRLDWTQISDIMREVKEKGTVRKDRVWGTSYIEKEFKPETTDK